MSVTGDEFRNRDYSIIVEPRRELARSTMILRMDREGRLTVRYLIAFSILFLQFWTRSGLYTPYLVEFRLRTRGTGVYCTATRKRQSPASNFHAAREVKKVHRHRACE